ncbi:MAG: PBP1A family penicillin-binding protein [Proteobacteria bacterium]|nr:PBP1A family penicillin-binding protein [Pseudomonadota bacterium]
MKKSPAIIVPKKKKRGLGVMFILLPVLLLLVLVPLVCAAVYFYFSYNLPRLSSLNDYRPPLVTEVYSRSGELIGEFFTERRYFVKLSNVSPVFIKAIVAAEDAQFFEHKGLNYWSISRAAFKNLLSLEMKQGGSTITQQITKSLLLTPEKSLARKIKEAILAKRIETSLTKNDILALYLNQIYFGLGAYGVESAARTYFGKSAAQLNLSEAALLAGLPKAPSLYSPFRNMERARQRQSYVLERMLEQKYITAQEKQEAEKAPLHMKPQENINLTQSPYFTEFVRQTIEKKYGSKALYEDGLRIETTLDTAMERAAQEAIQTGLEEYEKREKTVHDPVKAQAALVCMDPFSGNILAMVGGRDFSNTQFNRAVQAQRQPGSAFKPLIYAAALDKGYTPASIIVDSPVTFKISRNKVWEPKNYDETYLGPITLRKALTLSRNVATVKILQDIGISYAIAYAKNFGITSALNRDLSLALGTANLSLLDLVQAYAVFCAHGVRVEPCAITRIVDRDGNVLEENVPHLRQAVNPQTAYLMTSLLQSVVEEGTGKKVSAINRPCAGKTGTTNDFRDSWFIGFTPQLVTGAWVGYDDNRSLGKRETGGAVAAPIWLKFMQKVLKDEPVKMFEVPEGIVFVKINPETGYLPNTATEETIFECFKEGTTPMPYFNSAQEQ